MSKKSRETPPAERPIVGVLGGTREDLRTVAVCQKCITLCVLVYIADWVAIVVAQSVLPPMLLFMMVFVAIGVVLGGVVFVFVASKKMYGTGVAILLGVLAVVPLVCLSVLVVIGARAAAVLAIVPLVWPIVVVAVGARAAAVLRQNGHDVGFFGADLSEFPEP